MSPKLCPRNCDDSGLRNSWEEICIQVQGERSLLWDMYDDVVQGMAKGFCDELSSDEMSAIWLQTDSGVD